MSEREKIAKHVLNKHLQIRSEKKCERKLFKWRAANEDITSLSRQQLVKEAAAIIYLEKNNGT